MLRRFRALALMALLLLPVAVAGAPGKPRPATGIGLVIIRPLSSERRADLLALPLYRNPGVGRIRAIAAAELPGLTPVLAPEPGECAVAALGRKGDWLRVAFDDAGHEGWLEMARTWRLIRWDEFLSGRSARLLPGLRKGYYTVYAGPDSSSGELATLTRQDTLAIVRVAGDWARVITAGGAAGWLRWRDGDGRFLITVTHAADPQNR